MVIGGFWWKARFINNDGQIYRGPDKQYNLHLDPDDPNAGNPEFVKYETTVDTVKDYTCGTCHTTGYESGGHQDGKPGLVGTWAANGVQCEACHGPGGLHVQDPERIEMTIDRSNQLCGSCHVRGAVSSIPASGGFIKHHEQWNEMFTTKHATLQCVTCHDPHKGLHPLNPDRASAIRIQCESCHWKQAEDFRTAALPHYTVNVKCIDCHMARAAKSAAAWGTYEGDVRSHLWRINPDQNASLLDGTGTKANGYLTTDYVCMPCHPTKTRGELETAAALVH